MGIKTKIAVGAAEQIINFAKQHHSVTVAIKNYSSRALYSENWDDPKGNIYFTSQLPFVTPAIKYETYTDYPEDKILEEFVEIVESATAVVGVGGTKAALVWRFSGKANLFLLVAMNTGTIGDNQCNFVLSNGYINAAKWMETAYWVNYNQLKSLTTSRSGIKIEGEMTNDAQSVLTINLSDD